MVVFNDTPMEEGSGVFFLTAHFVIPVISILWRKVLECSSSPCSLRHPCVLTHSYGGRFWSVLPHCSLRYPCVLTHFVIPVFSHPWLVFSPISSLSLTSLSSHLTQVIPDYSLSHHSCYHSSHTQCSHTHPHSLHSPSHLIVIPGYSLPSLVLPCSLIPACSHITPTTTHSHECSHTECSHTHRHPWLLTHTTRLTLTHSSPRSLSPHFSECSHPSLVFSHSPSHIECHHTHSHILLTCVTTLSDLTSLVFWESVCSHFHGVVLPPSLPTHCSERTCVPTHTPMVSYYHQVITHTHTNPCAPTHFISPHSRYKCITNASQMHHQCITNHLPHSPTHHASITSSSPHHLFLSPITTNRFLSLHTTLLTPPFHSQPSQSSPKSSPISIHTHNDNSRTP